MKPLEQTNKIMIVPGDSHKESRFRELSPRGKRRAALWGTGFIIVGIPSMVLPILQGTLLILAGLVLLSLASKRMYGYMFKLQERFPRIKPAMSIAEEKVVKWFGLE